MKRNGKEREGGNGKRKKEENGVNYGTFSLIVFGYPFNRCRRASISLAAYFHPVSSQGDPGYPGAQGEPGPNGAPVRELCIPPCPLPCRHGRFWPISGVSIFDSFAFLGSQRGARQPRRARIQGNSGKVSRVKIPFTDLFLLKCSDLLPVRFSLLLLFLFFFLFLVVCKFVRPVLAFVRFVLWFVCSFVPYFDVSHRLFVRSCFSSRSIDGLFVFQGESGDVGRPGSAGADGDSVRALIALFAWSLLPFVVMEFSLFLCLQGEPGDSGSRGKQGYAGPQVGWTFESSITSSQDVPEAFPECYEAVTYSPEAVTYSPEAVTYSPEAVTYSPEAVTYSPEALTYWAVDF